MRQPNELLTEKELIKCVRSVLYLPVGGLARRTIQAAIVVFSLIVGKNVWNECWGNGRLG